jgi:Zn finger protein HypA/HybF involved in hydrogenase expression
MCSVGDAFNIEIQQLSTKIYRCDDCKNEFRGVGKKVICPSCESNKVTHIYKEE